ncbi:MAG TPA: hypothetical protein VFB63_32150 [Bryobacteraceae bacterium]|jgi:hypothetical protein|nr:hypothetical protein [Bryobacteraceae bacterium]
MSSVVPLAPERINELLTQLHRSVLHLHKALVDSEKKEWEQNRGPVGGPTQFLHMLLNEPAFAWMRPFSGLIVAIDEYQDAKEPKSAEEAKQLFGVARNVLRPPDFVESRYRDVLQRDASIVMLHARVVQVLNEAETEGL